jgi:hypothetical protein
LCVVVAGYNLPLIICEWAEITEMIKAMDTHQWVPIFSAGLFADEDMHIRVTVDTQFFVDDEFSRHLSASDEYTMNHHPLRVAPSILAHLSRPDQPCDPLYWYGEHQNEFGRLPTEAGRDLTRQLQDAPTANPLGFRDCYEERLINEYLALNGQLVAVQVCDVFISSWWSCSCIQQIFLRFFPSRVFVVCRFLRVETRSFAQSWRR